MSEQSSAAAFRKFQEKLAAFKAKVEVQESLFRTLTTELDALSSEFESLRHFVGASSTNFESSSLKSGATKTVNESTSQNFGSTSINSESTSQYFGASSQNFESTSVKNGATSHLNEASSQNSGATSGIPELSDFIRKSAQTVKVYFEQPNIPERMAKVLLSLRDRKKLSVLEMQEITGASRNSLVRDIRILKDLGWLEFHGSRKNGYFTLTDAFPGFGKA